MYNVHRLLSFTDKILHSLRPWRVARILFFYSWFFPIHTTHKRRHFLFCSCALGPLLHNELYKKFGDRNSKRCRHHGQNLFICHAKQINILADCKKKRKSNWTVFLLRLWKHTNVHGQTHARIQNKQMDQALSTNTQSNTNNDEHIMHKLNGHNNNDDFFVVPTND